MPVAVSVAVPGEPSRIPVDVARVDPFSYENRSLWLPSLVAVNVRTPLSMRYINSQSGDKWHSLCPL